MTVSRIPGFRSATIVACALAMTLFPDSSHAQRGDSGRSRGFGFMMQQRGGNGDDDRRERMRAFFTQMRSSNASPDERRRQMGEFFMRMRESRGGNSGGSSRWGSRGGSRQGGDRSRSSNPRREKKPKPRMTVDLPEQYAAQDKDQDGQLGLYEWKLSAIAQFKALDKNGDGFLTPRELTTAAEQTASQSGSGSGGSSTDTSAAAKTPAPTATTAVSTSAPQPASASATKKDPGTVRYAKYAFKALDKNKDGSLSADEWKQSKRTRTHFEKNKIELKLPTNEDGFVAAFPARR